MDRREFLRLIGLVGIPLFTPRILLWTAEPLAREGSPEWNRVLVLIELKGGNDGLNTVIPYRDDEYYRLRPRLAIPKDKVARLTDSVGLHPGLTPLTECWEAGELATVLGVGYQNPNRSHFRSIEIWETGSSSNEVLDHGWLSRIFSAVKPPREFAADGLVLGDGQPGPLAGGDVRAIAMRDTKSFLRQAKRMRPLDAPGAPGAMNHLLSVRRDLLRAARIIEEKHALAPPLGVEFPRTGIGRQLQNSAELLVAKVPLAVIKVGHGGFDTHSNQLGQHQRLLTQLADAMTAFRKALKKAGRWDEVLVMTYSEFGRRAAENGSGGTDHGTAAPHFLLGGQVKGGIYGQQPALQNLQRGDLVHTVDYRSLYATVAEKWWKLPRNASGLERFPTIPCLHENRVANL